MLSRARWKRDKQKSENKIGRLAMASFEQALRVRLSHQTEFDKHDNLTLPTWDCASLRSDSLSSPCESGHIKMLLKRKIPNTECWGF
ncbi:hypothetical protein, partial [Shewanella sp. BJSY2023SW001]|uniref:hypothetical protein n=1 Tax=Shewanella sp. BJSY2023SW001 TaxID=3392039 RepID=UPI0039B4DC14